MAKRLRKKKIVQVLEQAIVETHGDQVFEEHQNARAYNSGLMDGIGLALSMLKPKSSVISLTSTWWTEDQVDVERERERVIELQYIDMSDPEPVGLFETAEAQ